MVRKSDLRHLTLQVTDVFRREYPATPLTKLQLSLIARSEILAHLLYASLLFFLYSSLSRSLGVLFGEQENYFKGKPAVLSFI